MIDSNLASKNTSSANQIRSHPRPNCYLCGTLGGSLYEGLTDRLFGAPGEWRIKRCPSPRCGLLWLDPMPLEEDIGKAYYNYYTHQSVAPDRTPSSNYQRVLRLLKSAYLMNRFQYDDGLSTGLRKVIAAPVYLSPYHRADLELPLRYLVGKRGRRLLEIGCGSGAWLKLAEKVGWRAEGVDFDPEAAASARRKGLTVHVGQLRDLHFREASFDLVLMSHTIEHVHDPLGLLRESRRILTDGGLVVIWTPNSASWGHRQHGRRWVGLHPPQHLYIFNKEGLSSMVGGAGFALGAEFTTVRSAAPYFAAVRSSSHRLTGTQQGHASGAMRRRLYGQAMTVVERLMLYWRPFAGEELVVEGVK